MNVLLLHIEPKQKHLRRLLLNAWILSGRATKLSTSPVNPPLHSGYQQEMKQSINSNKTGHVEHNWLASNHY